MKASGTPVRGRTGNLQLRRLALYPIELRAHIKPQNHLNNAYQRLLKKPNKNARKFLLRSQTLYPAELRAHATTAVYHARTRNGSGLPCGTISIRTVPRAGEVAEWSKAAVC